MLLKLARTKNNFLAKPTKHRLTISDGEIEILRTAILQLKFKGGVALCIDELSSETEDAMKLLQRIERLLD